VEVKEIISSGLLELYATGLASSEEAVQVLQWANQYPEVAEELNQIQSGLDMFANAHAIQPDPSVKDKIFARISENGDTAKVVPFVNNKDGHAAKVIPISSFWKRAAAAAVALLIGSTVLNISQYKKNNDIAAQLNQSRQLVSNLQDKSRLMENDLQVIQSKYSTPVALNGLPTAPDAAAKVFWMKNTGDVYIDPSSLPAAPQGKQYELWAIVNGAPVNAGIIITTKKGDRYAIQKMKTFGKVEAFAISLEPENPNPATTPTTVVVMGKM
jgi:anti-sigma-K factor RskA